MQLTESLPPVTATAGVVADRVMRAFEYFGLKDLDTLQAIYAEDVSFEDPLIGIQGRTALIDFFRQQLRNTELCRFRFHRHLVQENDLFLSWTLTLRHKRLRSGETIRVEGSSYLRIKDGRIYYHRDYYDVGALIYENLPMIGCLIRLYRERLVP